MSDFDKDVNDTWANAHERGGEDAAKDAVNKRAKGPRKNADKVSPNDDGAPILKSMADIEPEKLTWLWANRMPLGKITMIAGDPGRGKSFVTLDIAARVSTGRAFPDSTPCEKGRVILLNAEDAAGDTIRPRLDALQADVSMILILDGVKLKGAKKYFNLSEDLAALEAALQSYPDVKLVIIDPISAYLGKTDSHCNSSVRALLAPLCDLASRYAVAFVLVTHFNKGNGGDTKALYRATGSLAFVAAARAAWTVLQCSEDEKRRLFLPMKSNLAEEMTGLAFRIVDGRVEWEPEPVKMNADEAMAVEFQQPERKSDAAADWLESVLKDGPVAVAELMKSSEAAGLKWRTVQRAKDDVGVIVERLGFTNGSWQWRKKAP